MKFAALLLLATLFAFPANCQTNEAPEDQGVEDYFKPVKWRNIGPFRGGRSVTACGVPGDPLTYYMGTTGGGLWKTDDAGQTWRNISDGFFKTGSVGAVGVAPSDPNVVYCGMGEHAPRGVMTSHGDGMYKSIDAGQTWKHIGLEKTQHIARLIIHPTNPDVVFVAVQGNLYGRNEERGIYKSTDGGETWKNVLYVDDRTGCSELSMDMNNPNIMYAAMWEHQRIPWQVISGGPGSGLYKSTDGGETWTELTEGLPEEKGKMAIAVCRSNSDKVYALIESDSQQEKGGLFVSNNAGKSWNRVSDDHRLIQRAWYYIEVFPDPNDENTVYVLSAPALRSEDGGKTWSRITGTHGDFHDLWINPENSKNLCIANDGGAAVSFNYGKSWSTQRNMPTAQFYRINVDNHFPYRIYGGQQDNSTVRIESRALGGGGIYEENWDVSAGGESAFLAFDPDAPDYVLGGSYLGTIEVLDVRANATTNIMPAPIQYLGMAASEMKYRYNWNAPIIWSQHEPNTHYHAAQLLLRTRDMGQTWEEVSPVLSRNEKEKQIKGGGPYTVEAVGAENYGTIAYVIESPHEAGVIWTASDDGMVHLTRDGCDTWKDVTPAGLQECLVNAIDISPHDPAKAYIATTRYKFNDHTPALYKTEDYGQTWTNISSGIPYGAFTRVVREDDRRPGLLYAGTETGVYISWDDGGSWQSLQLNLPVTPITDLRVHQGDLIASTSGRAFWILDDLGLLGQYEGEANDVKVYQPEPAYMVNARSELDRNSDSFKGTSTSKGINPATGVVIYYELPDLPDSANIKMTIRNANGQVVRTISSEKKSFKSWDGGPPRPARLDKKEGLNRFVWNMRHESMNGVEGVYIEGSYRGHKASPGVYTVTIEVEDEEYETTCEILKNPLYSVSDETYAEYSDFMKEMEDAVREMHDMVNSMEDSRTQLEDLLTKIDGKANKELIGDIRGVIAKMKVWDGEMVQRKTKAYDDVENFPNKFTANYLFLINQTESDIPRVNQPNKDQRDVMDAQWQELRTEGGMILTKDLPALNQKLWQAGIGAIWTGSSSRS